MMIIVTIMIMVRTVKIAMIMIKKITMRVTTLINLNLIMTIIAIIVQYCQPHTLTAFRFIHILVQ